MPVVIKLADMNKIRRLTPGQMATYDLLRDFERDLHIHIHLENNIIFPKAVTIEEQLNVIR